MYIACYGLLVAQRETEQMVVGGAIKELEWNWIDLVGAELMFWDHGGIQEAVYWSGIYEGADFSSQKEVRGEGDHEGIGVINVVITAKKPN